MARKDQGDNLQELKLQPGSTFRVTRRGLDTGTRSWMISTEVASAKAPKPGDADAVHKTMYVDEVGFDHMENGVTKVTANYLGLIGRKGEKADDIREDADTEMVSTKPPHRQRLVQYLRPIPRVTVVYVRDKKESIMLVGIPMLPPLDFGGGPARKAYQDKFSDDGAEILYEGWILKTRSVRAAGVGKKGAIYEMTDVFTYETITAPPEN